MPARSVIVADGRLSVPAGIRVPSNAGHPTEYPGLRGKPRNPGLASSRAVGSSAAARKLLANATDLKTRWIARRG